jgi:AcrR family transcriptional regulator
MLDPEVQAAFKRRRIADAMAELCIQQGYRATTVEHVSRHARVSRATIYGHFENREQVFLEVLDRGITELFERTELACKVSAPESRIEAGLKAVLLWVAEEPATAWACFVEALCATPEALRRYLDALARFATMLHAAAPTEVARPKTTEESLIGGVASILSGSIRAGQAGRAPELLPQLTVFLCGPFVASGPGERLT